MTHLLMIGVVDLTGVKSEEDSDLLKSLET